jgi:anti-sigma B factor antagonist
MFRYEKRDTSGVVLLVLQGNLDANTATQLKSEVVDLESHKAGKVVVDLAPLTLIDSTGVGVLISLFKRTRGIQGHVYFAGLAGQPKEIFRLLRLDRSLDVFSSVDEALEKIRQA